MKNYQHLYSKICHPGRSLMRAGLILSGRKTDTASGDGLEVKSEPLATMKIRVWRAKTSEWQDVK